MEVLERRLLVQQELRLSDPKPPKDTPPPPRPRAVAALAREVSKRTRCSSILGHVIIMSQ